MAKTKEKADGEEPEVQPTAEETAGASDGVEATVTQAEATVTTAEAPPVKTLNPPSTEMLHTAMKFLAVRALDPVSLKSFKEAFPEIWD